MLILQQDGAPADLVRSSLAVYPRKTLSSFCPVSGCRGLNSVDYSNSLNIPTASKITPLSVQLPHCLATHLSVSDSLRPWRCTNLLTYLLTNMLILQQHSAPADPARSSLAVLPRKTMSSFCPVNGCPTVVV